MRKLVAPPLDESGLYQEAMEGYTWRHHPLVERPWTAAVIVPFLAAGAMGAGLLLGHLLLSVPVGIVLLLSLRRYFLPTEYRLDPDGVTVRHLGATTHVSWPNLKRYSLEPHGIFLSPFEEPSRLENFRGIFLLTGEHREAVAAWLAKHWTKGTPHGEGVL
ncbi:MAG: hypothetical protein A2284_08940 [Deltaproteobacteria bacterium RIFOXYA12_FULL_61_11]|nr:MAG: hypothetical protein A2284_08940 [Deltaproteobacteria bacterium RIFOXYA12_FULL_61_11]